MHDGSTNQQTESRSPLREKPLRHSGQTLDEQIEHMFTDKAVPWICVAAFSGVWAVYEWYRWFTGLPPQPVAMSVLAVVVIAITVRHLRKLKIQIASLRQGRDGERIVGQQLDEMRELGWKILHDIPCDGFNVDHVVVCPHGIFTVETKTISKPSRGDAKIRFDGTHLLVNGRSLDRDPVSQAQAQSKWLRRLLNESTGRSYAVLPVVVFPGWFVEPMPRGVSRAVWVLNPKAVRSFIEKEPAVLQPEDMNLAAFHLSQYIRTRDVEQV